MRMRVWLWAGLLLTGVNCVAILDGDHPYQNGDTSINGTPCETDSTCSDSNPCTTDTCGAETRVCEHITQADGLAPDAEQTAADCMRVSCVRGQAVSEEDLQDVRNDNNSCTTDSCVAGMPVNDVLDDGTMCSVDMSMGTCVGGTCEIKCSTNSDCNDGNPCSEDLCNTSTAKCVYTNIDGMPTPGMAQVLGDCKVHYCQNGVSSEINDDADVEDDANPCTEDLCTLGVASHSNIPAATPCTNGDPHVCDGNGVCVDCTMPEHCVGITETECEKRACVNNTCQIAYEGNTTLASPMLQTTGDCKKVVCNGNMGTTSLPDNADLPVDSNPCTRDICSNGVPSNPPEAANVSCGGTMFCNGTGQCIGCTTASQCMGTDDFCKQRTCVNNMCGMSFTANGTDLPTGQFAGDCKVIECDGMGNTKTSVLTSDLPVDGNPCTQDVCSMTGTPSNPPTALNSACSVGGNDACDGMGNCKKSNGRTCAAGGECATSFCTDGVCCGTACTTLCMACNVTASLGTCTAVPKGTDDGTCTGSTQSCNAPNDCDVENGQSCLVNSDCLSNFCVDGVCCDSACTADCKACNVAGSVGSCSNVPSGNDDGACTGTNSCDGTGTCRGDNGAACTMASGCLSGFCVDGYCCNNACSGVCQSCSMASTGAANGTCANIFSGTDPDNECLTDCNGAGMCSP